MGRSDSSLALSAALHTASKPLPSGAGERLRALVAAHHGFVWRLLRRLGLPNADADDAAQQVFLTVARRIDTILEGKEQAFLVSTALHEVMQQRRRGRRRREVSDDDSVAEHRDASEGADDLLERRRGRALLDEIIGRLPIELRTVFVLFELEEMSTPQIAGLLGLPAGTVASRLRRAREAFNDDVARLQARRSFASGAK